MYVSHPSSFLKGKTLEVTFILQKQCKQVFFLSSGPYSGVLSVQIEADFWVYSLLAKAVS